MVLTSILHPNNYNHSAHCAPTSLIFFFLYTLFFLRFQRSLFFALFFPHFLTALAYRSSHSHSAANPNSLDDLSRRYRRLPPSCGRSSCLDLFRRGDGVAGCLPEIFPPPSSSSLIPDLVHSLTSHGPVVLRRCELRRSNVPPPAVTPDLDCAEGSRRGLKPENWLPSFGGGVVSSEQGGGNSWPNLSQEDGAKFELSGKDPKVLSVSEKSLRLTPPLTSCWRVFRR